MKNRIRFWSIGAFLGIFILTLESRTALQGARDGIELCLKTVIPSLFPFFILSNIIVSTSMGSNHTFLKPFARFCGIPDGMEGLLVPAFLGGYPIGAQTITQSWRSGQLPKEEAERLLTFCNNAGPSFLFGMAGALFSSPWTAWLLWLIHIASALLTATLIPPRRVVRGRLIQDPISIQKAMNHSVKAMSAVCGWVILFRILIIFLQRWFLWRFPLSIQTILIGSLELSNGCISLFDLTNHDLRFVLCSGILAFGGLCVFMQTISVTEGLSCRYFFIGKLLQTILSVGISMVIVRREQIVLAFLILLIPIFFLKNRKNSSNLSKAGV